MSTGYPWDIIHSRDDLKISIGYRVLLGMMKIKYLVVEANYYFRHRVYKNIDIINFHRYYNYK
jgi:hypothetical protein